MAYITREDGERFIIPSYRDTLSVKKTSLLKKEIMLLSSSYGEYITLQKKNVNEYEIAFSPDPGYLLGECVWQYFKRPYDMIYCEAIPNTSEAILVIVKSGSVYLDGSFPVDSIPEELVVFKTQQNAFNIFISGDVPISQFPEDGKISFDASSVKSFTELEQPLFPILPGVKAFQLQLVDVVLRSQGIGVLPTKQIFLGFIAVAMLGLVYWYITSEKEVIQVSFVAPTNPFQGYVEQLTSPDPTVQLTHLYQNIGRFYTMPGWVPTTIEYNPGFPARTTVGAQSLGATMALLLRWAEQNNAELQINPDGIKITLFSVSPPRSVPNYINRMNEVIATIIDRVSYVIKGNTIQISTPVNKRVFNEMTVIITLDNASPFMLVMLGNTLAGLPIILNKAVLKMDQAGLSGQITLKALGN